GTHALIQKEIKFKNLALAVVDEQHRFGVEQRAALQKSVLALKDGRPQEIPHLLSMTATPIPRTLALTIYGDLDISLLDEMPKGRQEIITRLVAPTDRPKAYEFVRQQVKQGRQVFVICPRIEPSDNQQKILKGEPLYPEREALEDEIRKARPVPSGTLAFVSGHGSAEARRAEAESEQKRVSERATLGRVNVSRGTGRALYWDDVKAVKEEYEKLHKIVFPNLKIAMLHGKMKSKEKENTMKDFKAGKIDILVSTSVVEVGIDVPNAALMLIEGAERFGLAQLHQFRGRVGRGGHQSYCLLFTDSASRQTQARLKALLTCKNGFELAEKDLTIRGPGEFFGTRQWGLPDLSMASLTDIEFIKEARQEAIKILQKDCQLKNYPALREKLVNFQKLIHLE
ncbi:MAG: ATP-dependent DNA helicase RecG, partial [Parcubacteria group bacterium LiPW_39]